MILVDFSPVAISNAYANMGDGTHPDKDEFREMIFATLATIRTKNEAEYGEMVVAMDSKPYWRRDVFPHYKQHRKKLQDIHWDVIDEVKQVLKERVPWKILEIPKVEADDIIGVLIHEFAPRSSEKFLIVSPDGDFKQLQIHSNVDQIDIGRGRVLEEPNARHFLQEQIICGQKKDTIPNILSDEDTMVNPAKRQKPMTAKKKAAWIGLDPSFFCETPEMMKRYRLNEKLIDLSKIPDDIKRNILMTFATTPKTPEKPLREYFVENRMANMVDRCSEFL